MGILVTVRTAAAVAGGAECLAGVYVVASPGPTVVHLPYASNGARGNVPARILADLPDFAAAAIPLALRAAAAGRRAAARGA